MVTHIHFNKYPVALSFKCLSGKCVNMGMVHSIIGSGDTFGSCATLHAAWGEDCLVPLPEFRLVCIPSLVLQKIKDVIPYICLFYLCLKFNISVLICTLKILWGLKWSAFKKKKMF